MNGGTHVLLDAVTPHDDWLQCEGSLTSFCHYAAKAAGATVIHQHWHTFEGGGVTGVLLLKESHITVHTYPEHKLATFDIYMCGQCDPMVACAKLMECMKDGTFRVKLIDRSTAGL